MSITANKMFDLHLSHGCESLPKVTDLANIIPDLATNEFCEKLVCDSPEFLGMSLSLSTAKILLGILKKNKFRARGVVVPTQYRDNLPRLDIETAFQIADKHLKEVQSGKYPNLHFYKTVYAKAFDSFMYFTFNAMAREWQEEGIIPGAIFASVDKLDGHIWSENEQKELRCD